MTNDDQLIKRLAERDPRAQRELFKKFNSRLFMYFRLRIKGLESYEDPVQEVFTSFFAAVEKNKIEEDKFIAPYIFGIAKRVMFNYFYHKKRDENLQRKGEELFDTSYQFQEEERLENESINRIVQKYVDKLPDIDKTILKEFYLKENNLGFVAELLGKTKHYVSVRKERALKKIKNEISRKMDAY